MENKAWYVYYLVDGEWAVTIGVFPDKREAEEYYHFVADFWETRGKANRPSVGYSVAPRFETAADAIKHNDLVEIYDDYFGGNE